MNIEDVIAISKLWDALVAISALFDKEDVVEMKRDLNSIMRSIGMASSADLSLQHILVECATKEEEFKGTSPSYSPSNDIIERMTILLDERCHSVRQAAFDMMNP